MKVDEMADVCLLFDPYSGKTLVTDYIQIFFEYNLLPKLLTDFYHATWISHKFGQFFATYPFLP